MVIGYSGTAVRVEGDAPEIDGASSASTCWTRERMYVELPSSIHSVRRELVYLYAYHKR